jgi:hypothetical protein
MLGFGPIDDLWIGFILEPAVVIGYQEPVKRIHNRLFIGGWRVESDLSGEKHWQAAEKKKEVVFHKDLELIFSSNLWTLG